MAQWVLYPVQATLHLARVAVLSPPSHVCHRAWHCQTQQQQLCARQQGQTENAHSVVWHSAGADAGTIGRPESVAERRASLHRKRPSLGPPTATLRLSAQRVESRCIVHSEAQTGDRKARPRCALEVDLQANPFGGTVEAEGRANKFQRFQGKVISVSLPTRSVSPWSAVCSVLEGLAACCWVSNLKCIRFAAGRAPGGVGLQIHGELNPQSGWILSTACHVLREQTFTA